MSQVLTGHPKVDAITQIHFEGNIVCNSWRTHVQYTTKRGTYTHHLALNLLADIVYWHRATEIRDEDTGATIGWKKRFKGERLQKNYKALAIQMGASVEQVKEACKLLVTLRLIELTFETVPRPNDTSLGNVMFIDVCTTAIAAISYRERLKLSDDLDRNPMDEITNRGGSESPPPLLVKSPIAPDEISHSSERNHPDVTEITTEISLSNPEQKKEQADVSTPEIPNPETSHISPAALSEKPETQVKPKDSHEGQCSDASLNSNEAIKAEVTISVLPLGSPGEVMNASRSFRDRTAERMSRTTAKLDWEIRPGVPYPAFVKWRSQHYIKQGGTWADAASANAESEIRNNPDRAADLWEQFLEYSNTAANTAIAHKDAGLTPVLPSCFADSKPATLDDLMGKLKDLGGDGVARVALASSTPTPSSNNTAVWNSGEPAVTLSLPGGESPHVTVSLPEPRTLVSADFDNPAAYSIFTPRQNLPESCPPPESIREKHIALVEAKLSMKKLDKKRFALEPESQLKKIKAWLSGDDICLRNEACAILMRRGDLNLVFDEEGNIIDCEEAF